MPELLSFPKWTELVLAGDRFISRPALRNLWAQEYTPEEAIAYFEEHDYFRPRPVPRGRPPLMNIERVQRRFAVVLSRECSRLLALKLEPAARAFVFSTHQSCIKTLGDGDDASLSPGQAE